MKKRILWIDILKILACLFVLINHTSLLIFKNNGYNYLNTLFYSIIFAICKMGVPLFIMISGLLLLKKESSYKDSLKRIERIIVPLLILSLIIYIKKYHTLNIIDFFKLIISNPIIVRFWYLYMLIPIYLAIPFINKMIKNFENKDYLVFILLFLLFPALLNIFSILKNIKISNIFITSLIPNYIATLILGKYLSQIDINKKYYNYSIIIMIISILTMILSLYIPFITNNKISYALDSWCSLPVISSAISLFYIMRYKYENKDIKYSKLINEISLTTFGIYLCHYFFVNEIYSLLSFIFKFNSCLGYIIFVIIFFSLWSIIIYLLRKIPIIKKYL